MPFSNFIDFWLFKALFDRQNTIRVSSFMPFVDFDKSNWQVSLNSWQESHHGSLGHVFMHDGAYRLSSDQCAFELENNTSYDDLNSYLIEDNSLVVCINIYEHPELLGDSQ